MQWCVLCAQESLLTTDTHFPGTPRDGAIGTLFLVNSDESAQAFLSMSQDSRFESFAVLVDAPFDDLKFQYLKLVAAGVDHSRIAGVLFTSFSNSSTPTASAGL